VVGGIAEDDRQLLSSRLGHPPFGSLHTVEAGAPAVETAERAEGLLAARLEAVARA
jgi:hypothetical protein